LKRTQDVQNTEQPTPAKPTTSQQTDSPSAHHILALQQTHGNQFVRRYIVQRVMIDGVNIPVKDLSDDQIHRLLTNPPSTITNDGFNEIADEKERRDKLKPPQSENKPPPQSGKLFTPEPMTTSSTKDNVKDSKQIVREDSEEDEPLTTTVTSSTPLLVYESLSDQIRGVYKKGEVLEIDLYGQSLGMTGPQITDLLEMGSIAKPNRKPPKMPLTVQQLKEHMARWKTVIEPRGYPYKFESKEAFNNFKVAVMGVLTKYGVPEGNLVVQGSSLRKPDAKDVDIAIFVSQDIFDLYAKKCLAGLTQRSTGRGKNKLIQGLNDQISEGYVNQFYFDRVEGGESFAREIYPILQEFGIAEVDISVMTTASHLALYPSMKF
jgi:hypothetical protein